MKKKIGLIFLILLVLLMAGGCLLPDAGKHPSAKSLRKAAIEWIEAAPCRGVVEGSGADSWVIGDEGGFIQWRGAGSWEWTYDADEGAFYLFDPADDASSPFVITKDWLETEGAYEQVAEMVGALARSLATNPYVLLKTGEIWNPVVFESLDRTAWTCSVTAELTDALRPYFPDSVLQKMLSNDADRSVGIAVSKEGGVLRATYVREKSSAETTCTWIRLGPAWFPAE